MVKKELNSKAVHGSSVKYQFFAAIVVDLLLVTYGTACGWPSPNIILLTSDDTPLPSGKISMDEASWIASLLCVGGFIGNIFFGFITNALGRKLPLILISIPGVVSWLLIVYAQNVYYLYAARILNGFVGGGFFILIPLFLNEISNDRVRGVLGSTVVFSCNIGMLIAFTVGAYCDFGVIPKMMTVLTILSTVSLIFFPETPSVLLKQDKIADTEKSIRFYQNVRGKPDDYELIQSKIENLRNTIGIKPNEMKRSSFKWSELMLKPARNAFMIGIVLASINQFCGCFAMLNYTANIFQEAGSSMSPNMSAIVVAMIQLFGSFVATYLVDRAGRKFLFTASTIGTGLGLIALGTYMMLKSWHIDVDAFSWVPITSFSFVIFIASWAVLTLPFLVISEVMPEKWKDFGVSFCMSVVWTLAFICIKIFPILIETLGFHGCMFFFAACCLSSALFIISYMPETKGRSHKQIMNLLQ